MFCTPLDCVYGVIMYAFPLYMFMCAAAHPLCATAATLDMLLSKWLTALPLIG